MEDKVNVLIVLKNRIIGEALTKYLEQEEGTRHFFMDGAGNCAAGYNIEVIVADHMSITRELLMRWPEAKVILLDTGLPQEEVITLLLMYNLRGIISPDEDVTLLRKALKLVHEGQIWIGNNNLKALLSKVGTNSNNRTMDSISKREHDILELITEGKKNKQIAAQLFVSEQTVKAHLSRIFKKFNVSSRTQLVSLLMHENR
jgi:DNA-binding NarL/FixJ family response regulator